MATSANTFPEAQGFVQLSIKWTVKPRKNPVRIQDLEHAVSVRGARALSVQEEQSPQALWEVHVTVIDEFVSDPLTLQQIHYQTMGERCLSPLSTSLFSPTGSARNSVEFPDEFQAFLARCSVPEASPYA